MTAENIFVLVLLSLTTLLILTMVVVLIAVLRQSQRISRLAEQMHDLAAHAEQVSEDLPDPAPAPAPEPPDKPAQS